MNAANLCLFRGNRETIFTCPYTLKFRTRPLAGTASGMASDSVRGRGNICEANLEIKSKRELLPGLMSSVVRAFTHGAMGRRIDPS